MALRAKSIVPDDRVGRLESENRALRARVSELERALGVTWSAPLELGLTVSEGRLLGAILTSPILTKASAMAALYGERSKPEVRIIDVLVCKLRKKLDAHGIRIETIRGQGLMIPPEDKEKLAQLSEREQRNRYTPPGDPSPRAKRSAAV